MSKNIVNVGITITQRIQLLEIICKYRLGKYRSINHFVQTAVKDLIDKEKLS